MAQVYSHFQVTLSCGGFEPILRQGWFFVNKWIWLTKRANINICTSHSLYKWGRHAKRVKGFILHWLPIPLKMRPHFIRKCSTTAITLDFNCLFNNSVTFFTLSWDSGPLALCILWVTLSSITFTFPLKLFFASFSFWSLYVLCSNPLLLRNHQHIISLWGCLCSNTSCRLKKL